MAGCRIEYLEEKVVHTALAPTLEKAAVLDLHDAESM